MIPNIFIILEPPKGEPKRPPPPGEASKSEPSKKDHFFRSHILLAGLAHGFGNAVVFGVLSFRRLAEALEPLLD
jgi:hypothetical protein